MIVMKRILLLALLFSFVSTAFLGTRGTTKVPRQLRISGLVRPLLLAGKYNNNQEAGSRAAHAIRCDETSPSHSRQALPMELRDTNVGAMLGRAGEEEILKPVAMCQTFRPNDRS